jgi:NADH-quinone oxidoreductase subunit F
VPTTLLFRDIDEPGLHTREVYERRGGYQNLRKALTMPPEAVLQEILAANVRGRGGAGFAMGKKASFLPKGQMDKYLVCNADESEPGTFNNRELMQKNPHLLIEGMIIASYAAGINRAFIYIRGEYAYQADILEAAVKEAGEAGYLGEQVLGSELTLSLAVHRGAGAYICGEETALLDSLEGKRGNPRLKPPVPGQPGPVPGPDAHQQRRDARDRAAHHRDGRRRVREDRRENSTGTKLVSVSGNVQRPGNYEIELGMKSRDIIYGLAGGRRTAARSSSGSRRLVSPGAAARDLDLPYDFDSMAKAGLRCSARARSSSSTTRSRSSTSPCGRRSSTATSRAASARRAARARTGP